MRTWLIRTFFRFDRQNLRDGLGRVGLAAGDVVLVHSSWDRFCGYSGNPASVIEELQACLGREGTLIMPTQPFSGSAQQYQQTAAVFDSERTPSRMGLLTEVFRRMKGVTRSRHPTHSVAVWGRLTSDLIRDHLSSSTPCGFGSPYHKLLEVNGKILLMGTDMRASTFNHFVEAVVEHKVPIRLFTPDLFTFRYKSADASIRTVSMRLFDLSASAKRDRLVLEHAMRARGLVRYAKIGLLRLTCCRAADVLAVTEKLIDEGIYLYKST